MQHFWLFVPALFFLLTLATAQQAFGSGVLLGISDPDCYGKAPKSATFTAQKSTYVFTGKCDLLHTRLNLSTTAPWTGTGTYEPETGRTTEDIIVPAPRLDEPSRPYGRFQATMHCIADPWLTTNLTCDGIVATADAPLDRVSPNAIGWRQPFPLAPIITGKVTEYGRPYSSILNDDVRKTLNVQYRNRFPFQARLDPSLTMITAPRIISPAPNAQVVISTDFKIQIVPQSLTGTQMLVHFTKLDVPAGYLTPTYAWTKPVSELANGVNLPGDIFTTGQGGRWSVRAKISLPKAGDFSADVPFTFVATNPNAPVQLRRRF